MKLATVLTAMILTLGAPSPSLDAQGGNGQATTTTLVTPATPTTHLVTNPRLEARLLTLLPHGTTIQDASRGFKNWGQFVAAAHVSNNLNIPFGDLKARMTGIPPGTLPGTTVLTTPMSLGQAIQSFKGTATMDTATFSSGRIRTEVKRAEDAANADLRTDIDWRSYYPAVNQTR